MDLANDGRSSLAAEVDARCLVLFDRWCEKRSVVLLARLMNCWPILGPTPALIQCLSRSLHDLTVSHFDSLSAADRIMIADFIAICNRMTPSAGE
jgi:hypothetical protein